jgi:hypothetical protein
MATETTSSTSFLDNYLIFAAGQLVFSGYSVSSTNKTDCTIGKDRQGDIRTDMDVNKGNNKITELRTIL